MNMLLIAQLASCHMLNNSMCSLGILPNVVQFYVCTRHLVICCTNSIYSLGILFCVAQYEYDISIHIIYLQEAGLSVYEFITRSEHVSC